MANDSQEPHATKSGANLVFQRLVDALNDSEDMPKTQGWAVRRSGDRIELSGVAIAVGVTDAVAKMKSLRAGLGELVRDKSYTNLSAAWKSYAEAARSVEEEAAIIVSGGFLPRACRACERFIP